MNRLKTLTIVMAVLALAAPAAFGQAVDTGETTLTLSVVPEASLTVAATTALTSQGTLFADYTGTTTFSYKIRTSKEKGTGSITAAVTSPFGPGGPSTSDLNYKCAVTGPGTPCTGTITAATTDTSVATFAENARSARAGNTGSVVWTLVNDPQYETGDHHKAVVTFTISAM